MIDMGQRIFFFIFLVHLAPKAYTAIAKVLRPNLKNFVWNLLIMIDSNNNLKSIPKTQIKFKNT